MGKNKKEHRKKVAKRNEMIKAQQKRIERAQEDFIKAMIEKERAAGKFDNNSPAPAIDVNLGEGLQI
jgi:hypothetical protein